MPSFVCSYEVGSTRGLRCLFLQKQSTTRIKRKKESIPEPSGGASLVWSHHQSVQPLPFLQPSSDNKHTPNQLLLLCWYIFSLWIVNSAACLRREKTLTVYVYPLTLTVYLQCYVFLISVVVLFFSWVEWLLPHAFIHQGKRFLAWMHRNFSAPLQKCRKTSETFVTTLYSELVAERVCAASYFQGMGAHIPRSATVNASFFCTSSSSFFFKKFPAKFLFPLPCRSKNQTTEKWK